MRLRDARPMIGDSPWDILAAKAAGHPAIGVDTPGFGHPALDEAGAVLVVDDLGDLLARLDAEPFS